MQIVDFTTARWEFVREPAIGGGQALVNSGKYLGLRAKRRLPELCFGARREAAPPDIGDPRGATGALRPE